MDQIYIYRYCNLWLLSVKKCKEWSFKFVMKAFRSKFGMLLYNL
jgi:hypothetical protein